MHAIIIEDGGTKQVQFGPPHVLIHVWASALILPFLFIPLHTRLYQGTTTHSLAYIIIMGNSVSKKKRNQQQRGMVGPPPLYSNPSLPPHHTTTTHDNEYSTNTAHSSNSILINSPTRQQFGSADSALAHLNPEYSSNRPRDSFEEEKAGYARGTAAAPNKPPLSQAEYNAMYQQGGGQQQQQQPHPHQHKHLSASSDYWPPVASTTVEDNQLTINSMNQLTVNSMKGMPLQIDDCIRRLIEVGYSNKTPKQLCLRASEVVTICRMAMDIFMSQPVSYARKGKKEGRKGVVVAKLYY